MLDRKLFSAFPKKSISELSYMGDGEGERQRASGKQRSYIYSLLDKADIWEEDLMKALGLEYGVKEFSVKDAGNAINYLKDEMGW